MSLEKVQLGHFIKCMFRSNVCHQLKKENTKPYRLRVVPCVGVGVAALCEQVLNDRNTNPNSTGCQPILWKKWGCVKISQIFTNSTNHKALKISLKDLNRFVEFLSEAHSFNIIRHFNTPSKNRFAMENHPDGWQVLRFRAYCYSCRRLLSSMWGAMSSGLTRWSLMTEEIG